MPNRHRDSQSPAPEPHRPRPATRRDVVASVLLTAIVPAAIWALSYPFVAAVAVTVAATLAVVGAVIARADGPSMTHRVAATVGRLGRP